MIYPHYAVVLTYGRETELKNEKEKAECETLIIQVPKKIMDFLRQLESKLKISPQQYAQHSIVEMVETDMQEPDNSIGSA
jgi:methylphosphotriester-DNA--protein-cysteine methyltransferase